MTDQRKVSKVELIKEKSQQLRGTIVEELTDTSETTFTGEAKDLLKHHGTYCQDDRDSRGTKNPDGTPAGKKFMMMVRTRIPGGRLTATQMLAELDLCDQFGNGTLRITTRQALQLHGILKTDLQSTIRAINDSKLTTLAACGDVSRNVMCCPAPYKNNPVRDEMQRMADGLAEHLRPKTTAYFDIWLRDTDGESEKVSEFKPVQEPIYGDTYLPRKFKIGIALPEDNCIDIYTQDLGFLAIVEENTIRGYNVLVGGGMGTTPSAQKCFPAVGKKMTYVTPDQVLAVAEAIVKVQRDFGNRGDRKIARMKYLIADWGLERFKAKVEEYFGSDLPIPHEADVTGIDDHMGWHEQGDGRLFLGVNIENGRIKDEGGLRLKSALRKILKKFEFPLRLTALQGLILCDIAPADRPEIDRIFEEHGVKGADELSLLRRLSIACPAFPTCGLAVTESERVLPQVIDELENEADRLGLADEQIAVHMTGCPNGCARPYTPDIGLVGKTKGKYTVFLGGNAEGTRLGFVYRDLVPLESIVSTVSPVLEQYSQERSNGESFGNFCHRVGQSGLVEQSNHS